MEENPTLDELSKDIHEMAMAKGFWQPMTRMSNEDSFIFYCKQLAMIHSEATEVLEALRKNKGGDVVTEELADIIIRVLDLYQGLLANGEATGSLHDSLIIKMETNALRPELHGVRG